MLFYKNDVPGLRCVSVERGEGDDARRVTVREGLHGQPLTLRDETVHASEHDAERAVEALAAEQIAQGYNTVGVIPEPHAARFFREQLAATLVAHYKVEPGDASTTLREQTESVYGRPLPDELAQHLVMRGSHEMGWCNFGEWRIWADDLIPFDYADGNLFEQLITRFNSHSLRLVLSDLVPVGTAGNGDGYYVFLDVQRPDDAAVYFLDHETDELSPFADTLSSLAEVNRLYEIDAGSLEVKGDPLDEVRRGMKRLASRLSLSWHYRSVQENSGVEPRFEPPPAPAQWMWFRSGWIGELMKGNLRDAGGWFGHVSEWHRKFMQWDKNKAYWSMQLPSRGLYWLYTLYFFGRPELEEAVAQLAGSRSRLVRDAAQVFGELCNGRTHVGKLDFAETRRRFLALDLDPDKAEARAAAVAEAKATRRAERKAAREAAVSWCRDRSVDALVSGIWERFDDAVAVKVIAAELASREARLARALERAKAVATRESGWEQALEVLQHSRQDDERAMLAYALAHADRYALQALTAALTDVERARVVQHGATWLEKVRLWTRAKYGKTEPIAALATLGVLDEAALQRLLERLTWSEGDDKDEDDEDEAEGAVEAARPAASNLGELRPVEAVHATAPDEDDDADDESDDLDEDEDSDEDESGDDSDEDEDEDEDEDDDLDEDEESDDDSDDDFEEDDTSAETEAETDDDDDAREVELDDEDPLVETPGYLRSITDKEPLRAVLAALGKHHSASAVAPVLGLLDNGPEEIKPAALLTLSKLPGDEARAALEAQLEHSLLRDLALYALALRHDPAALPAAERALAHHHGLADTMIYPRLMRESLRSDAGQTVDLELVRFALRTVMNNKFAAIELHVMALALIGKHADAEEIRRVATDFLDAEQAEVREAALTLLRQVEPDASVGILDAREIAALHAQGGVQALGEALRDPRRVYRDRVVLYAAEHGLLEELEADAIALVDHMARLPIYTGGYTSDGYPRLEYVIRALFATTSDAATAALHRWRTSSNPIARKAFEYQSAVEERLRKHGPLATPERLDVLSGRDLTAGVNTEILAQARFMLGAAVHAIGFFGDAVIVAGAGKVTAMDRQGAPHRHASGLVNGWGYDVAVHEASDRFAVGHSHGHCLVYQREGLQRVIDLEHGSAGVRKLAFSPSGRWLATACDDKTLHVWNMQTHGEERVHREPCDVNTVAWLDEDTLAFATDQHVGVIARESGEPRRLLTGAVAELQVVDGGLLVGTEKLGLVRIDPVTLTAGDSFPVKSVARVRVTGDGKSLLVACWAGAHTGLSRWSLASRALEEQLVDESLFGLEIDPHDGRGWFGGASQRVSLVQADGRLPPKLETATDGEAWLPMPESRVAITALHATEHADCIDVLEKNGTVSRYDLRRRLYRLLATPPMPLSRGAEAVVAVDGDDPAHGVVVTAFDTVLGYGGALTPWVRSLKRSEQVLRMGEVVLVGTGSHLAWLDGRTGEVKDERDAGIGTSWIIELQALDDDRFLVVGYDRAPLQVWSVSQKRCVEQLSLDRHYGDGRSAKIYAALVAAAQKWILVSFWNDSYEMYSYASGSLVHEFTLQLHDQSENMALSADGEKLVVGSKREVRCHALPSGEPLWRKPLDHDLGSLVMLANGDVVVGTESGSLLLLHETTTG